eukprot:2827599-Rhodomonas_salina.1
MESVSGAHTGTEKQKHRHLVHVVEAAAKKAGRRLWPRGRPRRRACTCQSPKTLPRRGAVLQSHDDCADQARSWRG